MNLKNFITSAISAIVLLFSINAVDAFAETITQQFKDNNGNVYSLDFKVIGNELNSVEVSSFELKTLRKRGHVNVTIPEVIQDSSTSIDYTVSSIGFSAFCGKKNINSVFIPSSVSYIDQYAFMDCVNLNNVAFSPNIMLSYIDCFAFKNCGITSIRIPSTVRLLKFGSFAFCRNLVDVVMENGVVDLGGRAFEGCPIRQINLPQSVAKIGFAAFCNCSNLTSIDFNGNSIEVSDCVFEGCQNLTLGYEFIQKMSPPSYYFQFPNSNWNNSQPRFRLCSGIKTWPL